MECPVCGAGLIHTDTDSRQEWCVDEYHCDRCENDFGWRIDFKIQSKQVAKEGWTHSRKELRQMTDKYDRLFVDTTPKTVPGFKRKKRPCRGCATPEHIVKVLSSRKFDQFYKREFDDFIGGQPEALDKTKIISLIEELFFKEK